MRSFLMHDGICVQRILRLLMTCVWMAVMTPGMVQAQAGLTRVALYHAEEARRDRYNTSHLASDGAFYVAYTSDRGGPENIFLRRHAPDGTEMERQLGDNTWRDIQPVITEDQSEGIWIFWSSKTDAGWDLFSRRYQAGKLSGIVSLTDHPGTDWMPEAVAGRDGAIHLFWVSFRNNNYEIMHRQWQNESWSTPENITDNPRHDYRPTAAVDSSGAVWVCWDSDRSGFYDLYARRLTNGRWSELQRLTDHPALDADPTLMVDGNGALWLAWQTNRTDGKPDSESHRTPLQTGRPRVWSMFYNGTAWRYPPPVADGEPAGAVTPIPLGDGNNPLMLLDPDGVPWICWFQGRGPGFLRNLSLNARPWMGDRWGDAVPVMEDFTDIYAYNHFAAFNPAGTMLLSYYTREGNRPGRRNPWADTVFDGQMALQQSEPAVRARGLNRSDIGSLAPPMTPATDAWTPVEYERVSIKGQEKRIYMGDNHSHNMLCDGRYQPDQHLAYAKYITRLDFAAITSHSQSFIRADWEMMKTLCRDYTRDGEFLVLSGYEWTNNDERGGHHVVIFPTYDQPLYSIKDIFSDWLYKFQPLIAGTSGITSTHHLGTVYRNWDQYDPTIEPYLEITSKSRVFESIPAAETPNFSIGGRKTNYQTIQSVMALGYRLGFIGNSDTHTGRLGAEAGITGAFMNDLSIPSMFEAFRNRLVYAAEGKIKLQMQVNGEWMGSEILADQLPEQREIKIVYSGTLPVQKVEIVRNNQDIYRYEGNGLNGSFTYIDREQIAEDRLFPAPFHNNRKTLYYYVRLTQTERSRAWSSPVWFRVAGSE